jgi:23S rRNA pseudouridine1911/1915/1917 synthase
MRRLEMEALEANIRLDKYLAGWVPELSRSAAQRLVEKGAATVNGEPVKASYKVTPGDSIVVYLPDDAPASTLPEQIPLDIVYEDDALLVIDKPAGMVVHPAPGHSGGTLVNALLAYAPELAQLGDVRPGIVHRLDRQTSGLILVAKSDKARRALQRQFKDREVHKSYLALLDGHLQPSWGQIEAPIGRDPRSRQRMAALPGGKEAITEYHVLERFAHETGPAAGDYTLVDAEPKTGRTHQIRVHFAAIGHPVVGDSVYGRRARLPLDRQFLHAKKLAFRHPITKHRLEVEASLPVDLAEVLTLLR